VTGVGAASSTKSESGPEVELLLACARLDLSAAGCEHMRDLLRGELDWEAVLSLAAVHGLRPLLFRHVQAMAPGSVPKAVFVELWGQHELLKRRNQAMVAELLTLLRLFAERGILAVPYKGPTLAMLAFGDLTLREFGDLDILLRPADILPAKHLLETFGYTPEFPLSPFVEQAFLRAHEHYHVMLHCQSRDMLVELHWRTDPEFPVERSNDPEWWAKRETVRFFDADVRSFAPHELLLILCLHGSKHHWERFGWLVDVAELIRRQPNLDWSWILDQAESLRAGRRLALGLHLLQQLLDVPLPTPVLAWLATQAKARRVADAVRAGMFDGSLLNLGAFQRLRLNLSLYETFWQKLRHSADVMFRPGLVEWSRWPLPGWLSILYLPLRVSLLLKKYVAKIFAA
jgi:hypothetical protein